ncbi:MAG: CvpA family protein, partial [Parcubacteria group bacterium]|nr:CvpA family protein [Parcubacteria group bacterium]
VHTFGALVGVFAGIYTAGYFFERLAPAIAFVFLNNMNWARWGAFVVIFSITNRLFGILFWVIELGFKIVSFLPFVKTFNRLGGAVFGFVEGILALSIFLYIASYLPLTPEINQMLLNSSLAKSLLVVAKILEPLLPDTVQAIL